MKTNFEKLLLIKTEESRKEYENARQIYFQASLEYEKTIKNFIIEKVTGEELFEERYEIAKECEYDYIQGYDDLHDYILEVNVYQLIIDDLIRDIEDGTRSDIDTIGSLKALI
jgi:hypothetical protein